MKIIDKIGLGAVGVILITNPASGQAILEVLESIFKVIFQFGSPINFVASAIIVVYIGYKIWDGRERTHVPKKGAKTKAQKFLTT